MTERHGLDWLLMRSAIPPGAALELCGGLAAQLESMHVGVLIPGQVELGEDGAVTLNGTSPGLSSDPVHVLGVFLYELVMNQPWSHAPERSDEQLEAARVQLALWPSGTEVADLVGALVRSSLDLQTACERCMLLRGRVGGPSLAAWTITAAGRRDMTPAPAGDLELPDAFTGSFPAGVLAGILADPKYVKRPLEKDPLVSPTTFRADTPEPAPGVEEIEGFMFSEELPSSPLAPPGAPTKKRSPPPKPGAGLYVVTALLVALALVFVWVLVS